MPSRLDIQDMREVAQLHGGKCLSKEYVDYDSPLKWMCSKGHTWDADYGIIKQGGWCVQCTREEKKKLSLAQMQDIARGHGGKCLSSVYIDNKTNLSWQCSKGHKWEANAGSVKNRNSWCPYCYGKTRKTLEDMYRLAEKHRGKCLSAKYINSRTKLKWQCSEGHQWQAVPGAIASGQWCPVCANRNSAEKRKSDIGEYIRIAEKHGGKLLSKEYINNRTPLIWQCKNKHTWQTSPGTIKMGTWCPRCAHKARRTIEEIKAKARDNGGKCLSDQYINGSTKLIFRCAKGHTWSAAPYKIFAGGWCYECGRQKIYNALRNDFSVYIKVAARHKGKLLTKEKDYQNNRTMLKWQCSKGHVWIAKALQVSRGSWCPQCAGKIKATIEDMSNLAKLKGGKCLSKTYYNTDTKLKWQCINRHVWEATPHSVKSGKWCQQCYFQRKKLKTMGHSLRI